MNRNRWDYGEESSRQKLPLYSRSATALPSIIAGPLWVILLDGVPRVERAPSREFRGRGRRQS